jgi:hypothetical protein
MNALKAEPLEYECQSCSGDIDMSFLGPKKRKSPTTFFAQMGQYGF